MDAELKAGAMGFEEGYVSKVKCEKYRFVSVRLFLSSLPPSPVLNPWEIDAHDQLRSSQAKARDSTLFKHLETSWTLSPLPSSYRSPPRTKVDLYLAYAFASPLHAAVVSGAWEKLSGMMIDGFEKRLGKVFGERK